jgi:hypothetical protein
MAGNSSPSSQLDRDQTEWVRAHEALSRLAQGRSAADALEGRCLAAHRGQLSIAGSVSTGVRFRHADGSDYGRVAGPAVAETQAKAFVALRGLGFRERDVRRVLAELSRSCDGRECELEGVLRGALLRLTSPGANSRRGGGHVGVASFWLTLLRLWRAWAVASTDQGLKGSSRTHVGGMLRRRGLGCVGE